ARLYYEERRFSDAATALQKIHDEQLTDAPWWTVAWFTGLVNVENNHLDEAIADFEKILDPNNTDPQRKFDFQRDYVVINELGNVLFSRAKEELDDPPQRNKFLRRAVDQFEKTLAIEAEDLDAHYG